VLLLAALVLGLVAGVLTDGKLANVSHLSFRWPWFVIAAVVIREAAVYSPLARIEGVQYVYAVALAMLVTWTAWHIRRIRAVWIVAIGALMNLIVVIANGARMPVAPALAGSLVQRGHLGQYEAMGPATNLNWLADWIGVPGALGGAYSPGDAAVAIGIAVVAFLATRQRDGTATKLDETSDRIGSYPP
jgi:Family of unknown function (DUF5317)